MARQAQRDPARVSAVRALLARLIDHAALFPPASLDMAAALAADREARAGEHAWMLDRFICPASRLGELPADVPVLSVVLDRGVADLEAVLASELPVALIEGRRPAVVPDVPVRPTGRWPPARTCAGSRARRSAAAA